MIDMNLFNEQAMKLFPSNQMPIDSTVIDVRAWLIELLYSEQWSAAQLSFFHAWMKKIDITKIQYTHYQINWKVCAAKTEASAEIYQLTVLLALNFLDENKGIQVAAEQRLKTINAIFKALDHIDDNVFDIKKSTVESELKTALMKHKAASEKPTQPFTPVKLDSQILPITVLFSEGPIARAYLATIKALGYKVRKIIKLVSRVDLINKKPVGGFLPQAMKINYAANKQFKQMFYWSNQYQKTAADAVNMIRNQVHKQFEFQPDTLSEATNPIDLSQYADVVESLFITGLKDPILANTISVAADDLYLYTGGGIVPDNLLAIKNKRIIHIHPGYLPEIRGADCVLWSQLLTQRLSASAFFMAPGIDVGDIILPCWLPDLVLNFPQNVDSRVKYRLVYGFLDPWVRAYALKQLIFSTNGLVKFTARPQAETEGMTYHFMHENFKQQVFENFQAVDV